MLASSFSTRFLLRKNRRSRLPAPPFGFAAQNRARHFAARNHPVRLSASRPWLRHPAPLFCRSRHACAAPGPQRQNPGACSHSVAFRLRRNRAAGRCPRRGQRARYPIFAPLKCGPAYSRGVCRGTFLCSPAGPALAPRRLLPFGRISLRETAQPVVAPTGGNVLATPFSLRSNVAPRSHPGACSRSVAFRSAKPRGRSSAPPGPMFWPASLSLCSSAVPRPKPRPSSFSTRFLLRKNRRARPPAFGRRGVDKVRKYHFVRVVLSSAPLTLSPLYAPARPVFRNRPKEKAAAENRCGCGISFTFPVFPPMRNKSPRMLCHSHPFNFALIPWGKQKRKARPLSFLALLRKAHLCPFCILSFLCRSRSRYRKVDSYSYFAIWYNSSTASCSEPVCFSIK